MELRETLETVEEQNSELTEKLESMEKDTKKVGSAPAGSCRQLATFVLFQTLTCRTG